MSAIVMLCKLEEKGKVREREGEREGERREGEEREWEGERGIKGERERGGREATAYIDKQHYYSCDRF